MSKFNLQLLQEVKQKLNHKTAFVASPQTQQAISSAQQQGAIEQTQPAPGTEENPQIGFPELAQLLQQGLEQMMQMQQQSMQLMQQLSVEMQAMKMGGKGGEKKKSVQERLDQMEGLMAQLTSGADQGAQQADAAQPSTPEEQQQMPPEQAAPQA
jgi:hypothetical protein